ARHGNRWVVSGVHGIRRVDAENPGRTLSELRPTQLNPPTIACVGAAADPRSPSRSSEDGAGAEYAALVRAAATGDRDAMERLLMRAQEVAYRFSLLVCGHPEDAEDVMQDALLKTYRYVNRIAEPEA